MLAVAYSRPVRMARVNNRRALGSDSASFHTARAWVEATAMSTPAPARMMPQRIAEDSNRSGAAEAST